MSISGVGQRTIVSRTNLTHALQFDKRIQKGQIYGWMHLKIIIIINYAYQIDLSNNLWLTFIFDSLDLSNFVRNM